VETQRGNICVVLAVFAKQHDIKLRMQALLYPAVSAFGIPFWQGSYFIVSPQNSMFGNAASPTLRAKSMLFLWETYLGEAGKADVLSNPRIFPVLFTANDLEGVASAYVTTVGIDVLRDERLAYAALLRKSGVPATHKHYEQTVHGFLSLPQLQHQKEGAAEVAKVLKDRQLQSYERKKRVIDCYSVEIKRVIVTPAFALPPRPFPFLQSFVSPKLPHPK